jgi:histone-lysine N-methyltransferase SETMAR
MVCKNCLCKNLQAAKNKKQLALAYKLRFCLLSLRLDNMDVHSHTAQRSVIFTLWKTGHSAPDIHVQLCSAHGSNAISMMTVYRWIEQFKAGRTDIADQHRSGRPHVRDSDTLAESILNLLDDDSRMTIREIADRLDTPRSSIHRSLASMDLVKLSARWIPKLLTSDLKQQRLQVCLNNLELVKQHGGWETFRQLIVTGDETWVPHFDPPTKQESKVWMTRGSDPPVKARREAHCKKVMLTLFFDINGPLTIDFLEPGTTINADRYIASLEKLKGDIRNKRRGDSKPFILHHDNARPHTAQKTTETVTRLKFGLLMHPPYSPDLAPADFALFPQMKSCLRGKIYENRDNLEQEVRHSLLHQIPRESYGSAIDGLLSRWKKCVQLGGDYVEKASIPCDD